MNVIKQHNVTVYTMTLPAADLVAISRVERFGEDRDGVNRKYNEAHAMDIAEAMIKPGTVMLDSICGDLKGGWKVEGGYLIAGPGAYLSIDDGQHRRGACELLNDEELAKWSFSVVATKGLDYETRLRVFRQQSKRRRIDSRLDLAQRYQLNDWNTDAEKHAYELVLLLAANDASPLKGMIQLEELVKRPHSRAHRVEGVSSAGLWSTLKSVLGKGSPLISLAPEKRVEVVLNLLTIASEVWSRAWTSDGHALRSARGINAVLMLLVSGPHFRAQLGEDFRAESLRSAIELARRFNWTNSSLKDTNQRELTKALDDAIGRNYQRKMDAGEVAIQA